MRLLRASVSAKLFAGISFLMLIMLVVIGAGLRLSTTLAVATKSNAASYRVLDNVDRAYGAIIDLANRSRAYVLSDGDPRRVKGYEDAKVFYDQSMAAARKELEDSPRKAEMMRALDAMDMASRAWREAIGDPIMRLASDKSTTKKALDLAGSSNAADVMQNYRNVVASARDELTRWSTLAQDEEDSSMRALIFGQIGGACALVAFALFLGWRLKVEIVAPVVGMTGAMRVLASGNLKTEIPYLIREDELGAMAKALQVFKESAIERDRIRREIDTNRAALDTARSALDTERQDADIRKTNELRRMVEQVEQETRDAVDLVVNLMDDMTDITSRMSTTAGDLSENSEAVAAAAHQTQSTMQNARQATERLSQSIDQLAERVRKTNEIASSAVDASRVTQTSIDALSQVVAEIDGVTRLITDIARQTNLLAINAGVEATRSGQDGKGFAVIALEVKSLSEQTSSATSKISGLVRQIHDSTGHAVRSVQAIASSIDSVNESARQMASAITDQVATTREIASGISETASANAEVTDRMQNIAVEAGSTGSQAQEVDAMCAEVARHVRDLQLSLVRIVRTCSSEIDRRQTSHVDTQINALIEYGSSCVNTTVIDLSEGGARITGLHSFGTQVTLRIPDFAYPLPGRVVGQFEQDARLQFQLDDTVERALSTYVIALDQDPRRLAA